MWQRIKNSLWYQNKTNPKEQLQGNEFYQLEWACEHHLPCTTSKPILACYTAPALVTPKTQDLKMYCMVIYSFFFIYVCLNEWEKGESERKREGGSGRENAAVIIKMRPSKFEVGKEVRMEGNDRNDVIESTCIQLKD